MRRWLIVLTLLAAGPVMAADLAQEPAFADTAALAGPTSLWRGHFSGGRNLDPHAEQIALDWKDDVAFFPNDLACRGWIRTLRSRYAAYQGFSGCLRIR